VGCPIRRSWDQSLFPAPPSLSQGITSFIASCCLGIHQTPLSRLIRPGKSKALPVQKFTFPAPRTLVHMQGTWSVYLTWIALRFVPGRTQKGPHGNRITHTRASQRNADVFLSLRCQLRANPLPGRTRQSNPSADGLDDLFPCVKSRQTRRVAESRLPVGLVEPIGIEPMTPCLQSRCSPS
jgi:hypothetical protein